MTGLDTIIKEIMDEAQAEADAAKAKAKAQADEILQKATSEAEAERAKIGASAGQTVADVTAARESALALQRRQRTLETKQALLNETLEKALEKLYSLPEGEYFELCHRLALRNAEDGEGALLFNEKDKARQPADFATKLAAALPTGKTIQVSGETRPIDGGFVLKYGDVEENCSFRAVFEARHEEFSDQIRPILFPEA